MRDSCKLQECHGCCILSVARRSHIKLSGIQYRCIGIIVLLDFPGKLYCLEGILYEFELQHIVMVWYGIHTRAQS